jgi:DNA-binding NarL/FixJ family response regulator
MKPLRILLVDDNMAFLQSVANLLSESPELSVAGWAQSGMDAVRMTQDLAPDLVIVDFLMLGMNGVEATQLLKTLPRPPRVILTSLYGDHAVEAAARHAGADAFVHKQELPSRLVPEITRLFPGPPGSA